MLQIPSNHYGIIFFFFFAIPWNLSKTKTVINPRKLNGCLGVEWSNGFLPPGHIFFTYVWVISSGNVKETFGKHSDRISHTRICTKRIGTLFRWWKHCKPLVQGYDHLVTNPPLCLGHAITKVIYANMSNFKQIICSSSRGLCGQVVCSTSLQTQCFNLGWRRP